MVDILDRQPELFPEQIVKGKDKKEILAHPTSGH